MAKLSKHYFFFIKARHSIEYIIIKIMNKLSVIIPFKSGSAFLRQSITSLEMQNFRNFEAVYIENGVKDSYRESFKSLDSRFKYVYSPIANVSNARNIGIKVSSGEYVAFIDIDDKMDSNYLELLYKKAKDGNCDVVLCNYRIERKLKVKEIISDLSGKDYIGAYLIKNTFMPNFYNFKDTGYVWRELISLSTIKKCNIKFDTNISIGEDVLFNLNVFLNCKKISFIKDVLYTYVISNSSAMNSYHKGLIQSQMYYYDQIYSLIENNNLSFDPDLYSANRFWGYYLSLINGTKNHEEIKQIIRFFNNDKKMRTRFLGSLESKSKSERLLATAMKSKNMLLIFLCVYLLKLKNKIKINHYLR